MAFVASTEAYRDGVHVDSTKIPPLYHLSQKKNQDGLWRIKDFKEKSDNVMNDDSATTIMPKSDRAKRRLALLKEPVFDKISFSVSIGGCLRALFPYAYNQLREEKRDKGTFQYYVYSPVVEDTTHLITEDKLTKDGSVWDAFYTHEWLCVDDVYMVYVGHIEAVIHQNDKTLIYPFGDKTLDEKFITGPKKPKWHWVEKAAPTTW